ncbi:hypothetical protein KKE06_05280 [Candidatus Micrarchaeota archaeon]|nr:hypothetical protein [Candidatus Micrarchaeota archaeon]MBU1929952.1 hypothetical protein [Candidatus Micrarchaeota archaeon]
MNISYDEVRRIYRLEKNTSKLVDVSEDFYNLLNEFIKEEKQRYLKSLKDFSIEEARDFANLKKMVEEIFLLRERKILNLALLASRGGEEITVVLAVPEKKMFSAVLDLLQKQRGLLTEMFQSNVPTKEASPQKTKSLETIKIQVSKDVPAFIGTDMKEYGPYKNTQKVELPFSIAKLFLERKLGERVSGVHHNM